MNPIDFVIPWVDGGDPQWQQQKRKWESSVADDAQIDNSSMRYRDWDNLRYWFRGVEKFAPWVRHVYFITNGQKPDWLNAGCEKLRFVTHEEYIPAEYLPTFSSHVIETNLHRIPDLAEQYVYFNDDTFLLREISPELFFREGLPVLPAELHPICPFKGTSTLLGHVYFNMFAAVNRNFNFRESFRQNRKKWLSPKYNGLKSVLTNWFYSKYSGFIGFEREHMPVPIRKSTMERVWAAEPELMETTSKNRFRTGDDVSQYIFRYWELAQGSFVPGTFGKAGKCLHLNDSCPEKADEVCRSISQQVCNMICINDAYESQALFDGAKQKINAALEALFPEPSSFEKQ